MDGNKILNIVLDLKNLIKANEKENSWIFRLVRKLPVNENEKSKDTNKLHSLTVSATNKDTDRLLYRSSSSSSVDGYSYIQMKSLIKKMELENTKLRESNVKLQRESKLQDQQIRHLNHQIACKERRILQKNLENAKIDKLRCILKVKRSQVKDLQQDLQILREKITNEQRIAKELQEERQRNIEKNKLKSNQNLTLRKMVEEIDILLKELINVVKIWTCQRALIENQSTITPLAEELLHRRKILRVAIKELLQVTPSKKRSKCLLQGWLLQNLTNPFAKKPSETSSDTSAHITEKSEKSRNSFLSEDSLLSRNFSLRRWASDSQLEKLTSRTIIH